MAAKDGTSCWEPREEVWGNTQLTGLRKTAWHNINFTVKRKTNEVEAVLDAYTRNFEMEWVVNARKAIFIAWRVYIVILNKHEHHLLGFCVYPNDEASENPKRLIKTSLLFINELNLSM